MPDEQSPWDDASFWRSDDRRPARGEGQRAGRAANGRSPASSYREDRRGGRAAGGGAAPGDDRPRRAGRPDYGTGRDGNGGGRFSQTADDLKNRLGIRGSVLSRGRDRDGDEDFWGESDRRRPSRRGGRDSASRPGAPGDGWTYSRAQPGQDNGNGDGNGRGAYRGTRRANSAANGHGANGYGANGHGAANGYGGAPNGNGAGSGFDDGGTGEWSGRTSVRDRAARFSDGVRSRTATLQRPGTRRAGGGPGGPGGGGGWDGGDPYDPRRLTRGQRFKHWLLYGSWWRHWTWRKALGVAGAGAAGCILLGILAMFIGYEMTPIPTAAELTANWQSSTIYFSNGKLLGTFNDDVNGQDVDRELLTANQIPTVMAQAMAAAEDRNFYTEGGISITGLARAALEDALGNGNLQGGSTITMQYAKNYYAGVDTGQNATTKLKEIFIAMKLAHERSKDWIMQQYLNTVPFGPTTYGLGAAAENYFNVNLTQPGATLTISQAAMLAAMPNEPGYFNPDPDAGEAYRALVARWKYVLTNMVRDGNITQAVANAQTFPKLNPPPTGNGESGYTGYLMQMVQQQLEAPKDQGGLGLTQQQLDTGGYRIRSTFSQAKVDQLARSVNEEKAQMAAAGVSLPDYDRIGAVLENAKTGAIVAVYGGPGYYSKGCDKTDCFLNTAEIPEPVGSSFKPYVLSTAVSEYMNVFTSQLNGFDPIWIPDNDTSCAELSLSRLSAPPTNPMVTGCGDIYYFPFTESGENDGKPISVAFAAATSSDPAFEDLAHRDGIQNVINMAESFGVGQSPFQEPCADDPSGTYADLMKYCSDLSGPEGLNAQFSPTESNQSTAGSPAIALGEGPLTPIEQATTFATLADDGVYHAPHVIESVEQGSQPISLYIPTHVVLSAAAAADVDYALSFDNVYGTAVNNVTFHQGGIIGKTGTLGSGADSSQAWFLGATPDQYAMAVALYTNDPGTQILDNLPAANGYSGSEGGGWPAAIWNNFFTTEWGNTPNVPVDQVFPTTNGYPFVTWIQATAKKATLPTCKPGQTMDCKPVCQPTFGQPCNPDPGHSCGIVIGQQCTNPSPSPSCGPFLGAGCTSPSPSPEPTPSCSPQFPGQCNTIGTDADVGQTTAATARAAPVVLTAVIEESPPVLTGALARAVT
ncbi:MAG TPA: transglycosylase domain-containing protein [Streptosporangiaceae bacterium]|nr:transglycosylase domain-containing protein [Streptosporangiaceae bacterium]